MLPKSHIKSHVLHDLPFATQLSLVSGTKVYVGTHGGALTHLYALAPCAQLVELFSQPHYKHMAKIWEVDYHSVDVGIAWGTQAYSIPIEKVSHAISAALNRHNNCMSRRVYAT